MEDVAGRFRELDARGEALYYDLAMRGASHSMRGARTMKGLSCCAGSQTSAVNQGRWCSSGKEAAQPKSG